LRVTGFDVFPKDIEDFWEDAGYPMSNRASFAQLHPQKIVLVLFEAGQLFKEIRRRVGSAIILDSIPIMRAFKIEADWHP
jgi:hypothetical protein